MMREVLRGFIRSRQCVPIGDRRGAPTRPPPAAGEFA